MLASEFIKEIINKSGLTCSALTNKRILYAFYKDCNDVVGMIEIGRDQIHGICLYHGWRPICRTTDPQLPNIIERWLKLACSDIDDRDK